MSEVNILEPVEIGDYTDISKNTSFSDHARNDLDGIADLMDSVLGLAKAEETQTSDDGENMGDLLPPEPPIEVLI